jgi:hypothetical protein
LRERFAQFGERGDLDLAGPLGGQAEASADLFQGLRGSAQAVVGADHRTLALVELVSQVADLTAFDLVEYLVVGQFGKGVGDLVADRAGAVRVLVEPLLQAARGTFGRPERLQLLAGEPGRPHQLPGGGLDAMVVQVRVACRPDRGQTPNSPVGQCHRPGQLRDELLHGLAHPERGICPEWCVQCWIVPLGGEQQAGHAFLEQLLALHSDAAGVVTGERGDRREERLDESAARIEVTGLGGDDQVPFLLRAEPLGVGHGTARPRRHH